MSNATDTRHPAMATLAQSLDGKSLEDLVVIRERLLLLKSKTNTAKHRDEQQGRSQEILNNKEALRSVQKTYAELLAEQRGLEQEFLRLREKLNDCSENIESVEANVTKQQAAIVSLEKAYNQKQELIAEVESRCSHLDYTLKKADSLIAEKRARLDGSNIPSLESLLEDYESISKGILDSSPKQLPNPRVPERDIGSQTGVVATFELFESDEGQPEGSDARSKRSTVPKRRSSPIIIPSQSTEAEPEPDVKRAKSGAPTVEREAVREFLTAHAAEVKELFRAQHAKIPPQRPVVTCTRITSGIWRVSDEHNKLYGFHHIIGNNTNEQSFSVVLRQVRISQRLLDSVQEGERVDASFADPRDAFEVSEALRALFETFRDSTMDVDKDRKT